MFKRVAAVRGVASDLAFPGLHCSCWSAPFATKAAKAPRRDPQTAAINGVIIEPAGTLNVARFRTAACGGGAVGVVEVEEEEEEEGAAVLRPFNEAPAAASALIASTCPAAAAAAIGVVRALPYAVRLSQKVRPTAFGFAPRSVHACVRVDRGGEEEEGGTPQTLVCLVINLF